MQMIDNDDESEELDEMIGGTCPFCGTTDFTCKHYALGITPNESGVSGGLAYDEAGEFLERLDKALIGTAEFGTSLVSGIAKDLCNEVFEAARNIADIDDVPGEFNEERFELLERILDSISGTVLLPHVTVYGGFPAEDESMIVWADNIELVQDSLKKEAKILEINWPTHFK